ncbi:MAG TPA: hypothetical protein VN381_09555 [Anaerovoracaceae bacterium]|nr:hypothetical protein [Anaerovoracaceae bacterium]
MKKEREVKVSMKKVYFVMMVLLIILLTPGCGQTSPADSADIPFQLDADGNYTGFERLPESYTTEQAIRDGCYVRVDSEPVPGQKAWDAFLEKTADGEDAFLRIVNCYDDEVYYNDLFYIDGYYRVFDSSAKDLQDRKFKHLLRLEGTLPNAARSDIVTILTDDESLTYLDVMWSFLSSSYPPSTSPFELIMIDRDA